MHRLKQSGAIVSRISPNSPCPCGLDAKYKRCCGRFHAGSPAPTAEALMRSRYSAYAAGEAAYILATTDPLGPHFERDEAAWLRSVQRFCSQTGFVGLRVLRAEEEGALGLVAFEASLEVGGQRRLMTELSRFRKEGDRWLYSGPQG